MKQQYYITASDSIEQISVNAMINDFNNGYLIFSVVMHNVNYDNSELKRNEDISKVLQGYIGVLPEKLPKGLAPKRTENGFQIELKGAAKPVKKDLYQMSHTEIEETKKEVENLIDIGFVRTTKSPRASLVPFASSKDGYLRFYIDYLPLNRFTVKNIYLLLRIDGLIDRIGALQHY